jgi:hypothetical protein
MWEYDTGMGSTWGADMAIGVDPRYYSVCMEQLDDYTPISLEELRVKIGSVRK